MKAIEEELIKNSIKADLVQLCGYYQYIPRIRCELKCRKEIPLSFLAPIVNGQATRKILPDYELSEILGISAIDVIKYAQYMRNIGYEIRNNKTNPQIEVGNWLIPYSFPTLTPLSVQLRKALR